MESCNILVAVEEDKEEGEDELRISQGLTQESSQRRLDEVLQAIKDEYKEGGQQLALHAHAILSRVLTDVHKMRIQSNAGDLHLNVVLKKMNDNTPNSIKRLKDFHKKYMVQ